MARKRDPPEPTMNKTKPITIMQWNARSLYDVKLKTFKTDLKAINPCIVILSETHWTDEYKVIFKAYNVFIKNRMNQRGGGVAILVKKSIPTYQKKTPPTYKIESVGVTIKHGKQNIDIISAYCPHGDCDKDEIFQLMETTGEHAIIAGDFNAYHNRWEEPCTQNRAGAAIDAALGEEHRFIVSTPKNLGTRRGANRISTIDLTLTTATITSLTKIKRGPTDWDSDHFPLIIDLDINLKRINTTINWRFDKKKWNHWNEDIEKYTSDRQIDNASTSAEAYNILYSGMIASAEQHFSRQPKDQREPERPWWNNDCRMAVSRARAARRRWLNQPFNPALKTELNRLEAIRNRTIKRASRESWEAHINALEADGNSKAFWSFTNCMINGFGKPTMTYPTMTSKHGVSLKDNVVKANEFLEHFCPSNHLTARIVTDFEMSLEDQIRLSSSAFGRSGINSEISIQELHHALKNLKKSAMGRDKIQNEMLTNLNNNNRLTLLMVLNRMFNTSYVPLDWKEALVVPIPKPGKPPEVADSYRPISLTSCLAKCMERIINRRLQWHLENKGYLQSIQTGFRRNCCTVDHIVNLESAVKLAANSKQTVVAVFLDLAKAYDNTWINGLIYKLAKREVNGHCLRWIQNFLQERTMVVKTEDAISARRTLMTGVPQGCVLSPTLFNVMMADFPTRKEEVTTATFADDIEIHSSAKTTQAATATLQNYLKIVEKWIKKWKMKLSVSKCATLVFSRSHTRQIAHLVLNNEPIPQVNSFKFLGVTFDSRLSWRSHIDSLINRLQKTANLFKILTSKHSCLQIPSLVRIYKALTRSKIDYGAAVLIGTSPSLKARVEAAQNSILRIILGAMISTPTKLLNLETGIVPVGCRWNWLATTYFITLNHRRNNPAYLSTKQILAKPDWLPRAIPAAFSASKQLRRMVKDLFKRNKLDRQEIPKIPPWDDLKFETKLFPMTK